MVNASTQLLNINQLKPNKRNCLNQEINTNNFSNTKFIVNLNLNDKYIDLATNNLFDLLTTKTKDNLQSKKKKYKYLN